MFYRDLDRVEKRKRESPGPSKRCFEQCKRPVQPFFDWRTRIRDDLDAIGGYTAEPVCYPSA